MTVRVEAIPCLSDNYAWLLTDEATGTVALCDPGEAAPCLAAIQAAGGRLDMVLLTHHHGDHVDGVAEVVARTGARVIGAKADAHRLPKLDQAVSPGDTLAIGAATAQVLDSPGHTLGHIAFHVPEASAVLCGDTLFATGCGRLLEGTPADMFAALATLAKLPAETLVCCGHEYTESNIRFALTVEPENAALRAWAAKAAALRAEGKPTVPTTIGHELATNPFMRAGDVATLAERRRGKDNFR
ncbi:hydroxyacylglutathione hydrolase [Humitalea rosea]|uniref:Hydroxyacylglutathione hydrolase n=1 Tax=Humitalea rosea TaxID=990373 RepID=A0A2W7INU2_9PROT|nr:hydroxyacylglutathione hydrolase [Humitalea rosea]PZW47038.1 hydroxyacylglutathione hydrolase [Humitalea rosea]